MIRRLWKRDNLTARITRTRSSDPRLNPNVSHVAALVPLHSSSFSTSRRNLKWTRSKLPYLVLLAASASLAAYILQHSNPVSSSLNPDTFSVYSIVSKEQVSSTSSLFTLEASQPSSCARDCYRKASKKGLWSVEFKQPHMQIARAYTPIPPFPPSHNATSADENGSNLRFLIRREKEGEVSGYLHGLKEGSKIELRGPIIEYPIPEDVEKVIFLAGGTGVAPALQLAESLFELRNGRPTPKLHILWANRRREDCVRSEPEISNDPKGSSHRGLVVEQLEKMTEKYKGHITVEYYVDEEGTYIRENSIAPLLGNGLKDATSTSQRRMVIVSGPDGFVRHYAGPKHWEPGQQGQGNLGGVLGRMNLKEWGVWKL